MSNRQGKEPFARLDWDRHQDEQIVPAELHPWGVTHIGPDPERVSGDLYLGESAGVMDNLLAEHEGKIDLIYLDPPFLTGNAYQARIGRNEDSRRPEEWETVQSYRDTWEDGAEYLDMLSLRLKLMYRLLAPTGSLYLHLDWHASAYARVLLDEVFGPDRLLNEIVWVYHGPSPIKSAFNRKHDTILAYTKSNNYTFNVDDVRVPYKDSTVKTFASSPKAGFGKKPDLKRGKVPEDWWYFPVVARLHNERTGYPTQKPEALMERIILASSNPGDLVADFFVGSGTTVSVASQNGRRWLASDASQLAVMTTYRRLLLDEQPGTIRLWEDKNLEFIEQLKPEAAITRRDEELLVKLTNVRAAGDPEVSFPDDITIWEIDAAYEGDNFRSDQQVVRGWRDEALPTSISLTDIAVGDSPIAIRVFDNRGRSGLIAIKV
ncbi:MAG: site-specific DNA-methyltransferase [Anaerolineales bacterium]|jgi:DNA modification methylase